MVVRQCLPARVCLSQQLAPQGQRSQAQRNLWARWSKSGVVERRRRFASISGVSDVDLLRPAHLAPPPWENPELYIAPRSALYRLLAALRTKDAAAISAHFIAWTRILGEEDARGHDAALRQFNMLSSPVLSEIIRGIDPARYPEMDVANGLIVRQGQTRMTDVGKLMDEYGARAHHGVLLRGIATIIYLRQGNQLCPLRVADFEVFLRIAGITSDHNLTSIFISMSNDHGLEDSRTARTWIEFLRARFMTEPSYYQFDRNRVVVNPLNLVTHDDVLDSKQDDDLGSATKARLAAMDSLRFSANARERQPWNRNRDDPLEDNRRLLRRQGNTSFKSFWSAWTRLRMSPYDFGDMLPTAIEAFSRSNSSYSILQDILLPFYGIELDPETQEVTGGLDIEKHSNMYPTDRLLFALVEAFGSMSEISAGMRIIDFISRRYDVTISAKTWSNLLNWSYVCASKKLRVSRTLLGKEDDGTFVNTGDVLHVWEVMTSPPYNITPSFEDLDTHIRTLIILRRVGDAIDLIKSTAMPFYDAVSREYETALVDEVLLNDAHRDRPTTRSSRTVSSVVSAASFAFQRRSRAETRKDYVFNRIALWFQDILSKVSDSERHRKSSLTSVGIPDLVRDFPEFFPAGIRYRTATGEVSLRGVGATPRFKWQHTSRQVLSQKKGAHDVFTFQLDKKGQRRKVKDPETGKYVENPDFHWPTNRRMEIREVEKMAFERSHMALVPPPGTHDRRQTNVWWAKLEREMSM